MLTSALRALEKSLKWKVYIGSYYCRPHHHHRLRRIILIRTNKPQIPQKLTANPAPMPRYNNSLIESPSSFSIDGFVRLEFFHLL